jgi:hypothetical protein
VIGLAFKNGLSIAISAAIPLGFIKFYSHPVTLVLTFNFSNKLDDPNLAFMLEWDK